jgi:small subunit ribosomal protein S4
MSIIIQSKHKKCRNLGGCLWGSAKCPHLRKNYAPGQHGQLKSNKGISDYGKQLQAKQRIRFHYNITEKQFKRIFQEASRLRGDTGELLVGLLERRLDAIVYRANFASTIFAAKQLVSHKHIRVNGKIVNIPGYRVKEGDIIELSAKAKEFAIVIQTVETKSRDIPAYLELDGKAKAIKFIRTPSLSEVPYPTTMEPKLVVEFYSR